MRSAEKSAQSVAATETEAGPGSRVRKGTAGEKPAVPRSFVAMARTRYAVFVERPKSSASNAPTADAGGSSSSATGAMNPASSGAATWIVTAPDEPPMPKLPRLPATTRFV